MARDTQGIQIRKWAAAAPAAVVGTPEDAGITWAGGWPARFAIDSYPALQTFNGLFRVITALAKDIESHGILEWSAGVEPGYQHPCMVLGSDGLIYRSVRAGGEVLDPVTDSSFSYWRPILPVEFLEFASVEIIKAGTSTTHIVTPRRLLDALFIASPESRWQATTSKFGLARRASAAEITGRSGSHFIAAQDLPVIPPAPPNASTARRGLAEQATLTEAKAKTDNERFVTPRGIAEAVPNATTATRGIVELDTNTEGETGTDTERAMTAAATTAAINSVQGIVDKVVQQIMNQRTGGQLLGVWAGTQAEFAALTTKSDQVLYFRTRNP